MLETYFSEKKLPLGWKTKWAAITTILEEGKNIAVACPGIPATEGQNRVLFLEVSLT